MHPLIPRPLALAAVLLTLGVSQAATAALHIDVVASPDPPRPGELLDVEITVTNDGGSTLTDVSVLLDMPTGIKFVAEAYFDGDCASTTCEFPEQALFNIPTLLPSKGITFHVPAEIDDLAVSGTVVDFNVQVIDDMVVGDTATTSVTVDEFRELELALVEDRDPVAPGDEITYTLTWGLLDTSPGLTGGMLSMPVPAGMTFVSASDGGIDNAGTVEWSLGNLNQSDRGERSVTLLVGGGVGTGTMVTAMATLDDSGGLGTSSTSSEAVTRIDVPVPLEVSVVASPDPARPGETIDLEIMVTNTGAFDRTGINLRMMVPEHLEGLSEAFFDGDCPSTACEKRERALFDIGTLSPGEGIAYSLPMRVAAGVASGTVITFDAEVLDNQGDQRESGCSLAVDANRDIELALTENRDPASPGSLITYTLTWGLRPPSAGVPGTALSLPVPDGTTFVSASDGGTLGSGVVSWALGAIDPGESGERTMTVLVDGGAGSGTIVSAEARLEDIASPASIVRYQTAVRIQPENPLELRLTASPDPARPLEVLDVELTITNDGAFDRNDVVARVEIPDHLVGLAEAYFLGDCGSTACEARESATFDIGTIPAGRGVTLSMPFQVAAGTPDGTVTSFEADVTDSQGDFREAGTSIAVRDTRVLDLALVESDDPVQPGALLTYTLTYGTIFTSGGAPGATLAFRVPDNATFVSASNSGTFDGTDTVNWSVGGLNRGAGGSRRVTVLVDALADPGDVVAADASFVYAGAPEEEIRFSEETRLEATSPLDVEVTASPTPNAPGSPLNIELSVTNTAALDRTGITIRLDIPENLGSLADAGFPGDCPSTACEAREFAIFTIPILPAGQTDVFLLQPLGDAMALNGTVINFDAIAVDSTNFHASDGDALMLGNQFSPAHGSDLDADGMIGVSDLLELLAGWGPCPDPDVCVGDIDGDGIIGVADLLALLAAWG